MIKSFKYAIRGVITTVRCGRNMRIHMAFAFYVILAAAVTGASRLEWCAVLVCVGAVLSAELLNTAIEHLCNALHPEFSVKIGAVKDIAAGAVLTLAVVSAVIGGIIFFNAKKINAALSLAQRNIPLAALIIASVPTLFYLVFRRYDK